MWTNVKIANGASESDAVDVWQQAVVGIEMPSAWTAADITFLAAETEGGTYRPVHDAAGTEVTVTTDADRFVVLGIDSLRGVRFLKLRSGTDAVAVNQGAERVLAVHLAPVGV